MKKQFTSEQLFSLVDGRLSTGIEDVYDMLNHVCDTSLMTHHLPVAFDYLKLKNPEWFKEVKKDLDVIGDRTLGSTKMRDKFEPFIKCVKENNKTYDIPQLKDEFDTSDFGEFMVKNSLLIKKFS